MKSPTAAARLWSDHLFLFQTDAVPHQQATQHHQMGCSPRAAVSRSTRRTTPPAPALSQPFRGRLVTQSLSRLGMTFSTNKLLFPLSPCSSTAAQPWQEVSLDDMTHWVQVSCSFREKSNQALKKKNKTLPQMKISTIF